MSDKKEGLMKKFIKWVRAGLIGIAGAIGIGGATIGDGNEIKRLNERQGIEAEIEDKKTAHEKFQEELSVEAFDEIRIETSNEVGELENSEEVLNYIKQIYIEKYNENNNVKKGIEDVRFNKSSFDKVFFKDENGILRYCSEKEAKEMGKPIDGNLPIISATVADEKGAIQENVAQKSNGEIVNIYDKDEQILGDEDTTLTQLGDVVLAGINYSTAIEQDGNSWKTKKDYENKLINALTEYRKEQEPQQEETEKENTNTVNEQIQQEDDERY